MEDADYNYRDFCSNIRNLYNNTHFQEDACVEFNVDEKYIKETPLSEEEKTGLIEYFNKYKDTILTEDNIYDFYIQLLVMRIKHINDNFDFIPDEIINECVDYCKEITYGNPEKTIVGYLFNNFKKDCQIKRKIPKVICEIIKPETWEFEAFNQCVQSDGTYNIQNTGLKFDKTKLYNEKHIIILLNGSH